MLFTFFSLFLSFLCFVILCILFFFFFFFFSSRRRHTRCSRDWSSDVCSSDLLEMRGISKSYGPVHANVGIDLTVMAGSIVGRSEERRVGKECRSRWWREQ